ncbi:RNA-directed DNA polymerase, eukaryota [Tanacetum coccineum]
MANGIGFRTNSNPEIKRNVQHVNNRNHEQQNQGIPSKPNLNFRAVHKSYSSIFVSNIPWKATVQDLWDTCNQRGVVIDVYIAAKRSKSGHRFGFLEERSGNNKPNEGMNTQPVRDNANVFQSFNSYAKAVLGNKSVGVSGNNDACNSGEKPVGVSVSNKENEESSNEALMFISEDDCIDFDGMERSILAKVKDLSVITDLLKYMSSEGFVDVGLRYVGGRWVWLEFDHRIRCVWIDLVGLPLASWAPEVYKKLGGRWGCSVFTDMVNDGPMSHGKFGEKQPSRSRVDEQPSRVEKQPSPQAAESTSSRVNKDDPDIIHFDNSSDLPLSTSLNDLDNATLHIDGQSTVVDAPPDIIDVPDEDDDITDDEDALPHDLADSDAFTSRGS